MIFGHKNVASQPPKDPLPPKPRSVGTVISVPLWGMQLGLLVLSVSAVFATIAVLYTMIETYRQDAFQRSVHQYDRQMARQFETDANGKILDSDLVDRGDPAPYAGCSSKVPAGDGSLGDDPTAMLLYHETFTMCMLNQPPEWLCRKANRRQLVGQLRIYLQLRHDLTIKAEAATARTSISTGVGTSHDVAGKMRELAALGYLNVDDFWLDPAYAQDVSSLVAAVSGVPITKDRCQ
jgi:hypothetical protein